MPVNCQKHGLGSPCPKCDKDEYERCDAENKLLILEGKPPKHDLRELKKRIEAF